MAGARGRSGGPRPAAGRPRGSVNRETADTREMYRRELAEEARELLAEARRRGEQVRGLPKDERRAAIRFILRLLTRLALKGSDRAAIHLDERLSGRVKYQVEQSGPDGGPIPVDQTTRDVTYVCELADGSPAFAGQPAPVPDRAPAQSVPRGRRGRVHADR